MAYTYDQHKRPQRERTGALPAQTTAPGPSLDALMAGRATPSAAQKGRPIDLDGAMKAKMEHAFGDLSNLKLYESRAVGDAGAEAIAQGNEIAFAPGMADFSSRSGQERLGHELSHVMGQRSGAVRGRGFLANSALEARADREGAMAAAGQQVYTGPVTRALSGAAPSTAMAGAMQASRDEDRWKEHGEAARHKLTEAMQMPDDDPNQNKLRPYQISEKQLSKNKFNPTESKALAMGQAQIDSATSPAQAYAIFSALAGNGEGTMKKRNGTPWNPTEVDPERFKAKLKNMLRMVHDYPELRGKIGNMKPTKKFGAAMSAGNTYGGTRKAGLQYGSLWDRWGIFGSLARFVSNTWDNLTGYSSAPDEYTGNHELGHVLESTLLDPKNKDAAKEDWRNHATSNAMLQRVLSYGTVLTPQEKKQIKLHEQSQPDKRIVAGQVDLEGSQLQQKGITSGYGMSNAGEAIAEAFADVYANGNKARPASIALMKEYERRRDKLRDKEKNAKAPGKQGPKESLNLIHDDDRPEFLIHDDNEPIDLLGPKPEPKQTNEGLSADPAVIEERRKKMEQIDAEDAKKSHTDFYRPGMKELGEELTQRYNSKDYVFGFEDFLSTSTDKKERQKTGIPGLVPNRMFSSLATDRGRGFDMSAEEISQMMDDLMAPQKRGMNEKEKQDASLRFDRGVKNYKKVLLADMKHVEKIYGKMLTQLHPEDVQAQLGSGKQYDMIFRFNQDANQLMNAGGKYFDYENNEEDRQFRDLNTYFGAMSATKVLYSTATKQGVANSAKDLEAMIGRTNFTKQIEEGEKKINGPGMTPAQHKKYLANLKKRAKNDNRLKGKLFGRYK